MSKRPQRKTDPRRFIVLGLSLILVTTFLWMSSQLEQTANVKAIAAACGRIGLILGALWLAWPTLRRPAKWLPPGFAMLGVVLLGVIATQPRTILVMAPAFMALLAVASVIRAFRK